MMYECWKCPDCESFMFLPVGEDYEHNRKLIPAGFVVHLTIEADTWTEAMTKYHEAMGWEPYG